MAAFFAELSPWLTHGLAFGAGWVAGVTTLILAFTAGVGLLARAEPPEE